jgi:hypothetical protein
MRHRHPVVVVHVAARVLLVMLGRMRRTMRCGRETIDGVTSGTRAAELGEARIVANVALHDRVPRGVGRVRWVGWRGRELSRRVLYWRVQLMFMVEMAMVVERLMMSWRQRRFRRTREGGRRRLVLRRRRRWVVRAS